jgi:hypothetical protein
MISSESDAGPMVPMILTLFDGCITECTLVKPIGTILAVFDEFFLYSCHHCCGVDVTASFHKQRVELSVLAAAVTLVTK